VYYLVIALIVIVTINVVLTMFRLPKNKMNKKRWRVLNRNVLACLLSVLFFFVCTFHYSIDLSAKRSEAIVNILLEPLIPNSATYLFDTGTEIYYKSNDNIMSNDSKEVIIIESNLIEPQILEYEIEYVHRHERFWKIFLGKKIKEKQKLYKLYIPTDGEISEGSKKNNY